MLNLQNKIRYIGLIISHKISDKRDAITADEAYENKKNQEDMRGI